MNKSPEAFRTISEAAEELDLPQHVLRFWETRFTQIKPMKRGGGRRYYRPADIELLKGIRHLLYDNGYTIRGVQRILREEGVGRVIGIARGDVVVGPQEPAAAKAGAAEAAAGEAAAGEAGQAQEAGPGAAPAVALDEAQSRELRLAMEELTAARRLLGAAS